MKVSKVICSLSVGDIQTVALEEIGRELSVDEIKKVTDVIAEKINWYNAISESIFENISNQDFVIS